MKVIIWVVFVLSSSAVGFVAVSSLLAKTQTTAGKEYNINLWKRGQVVSLDSLYKAADFPLPYFQAYPTIDYRGIIRVQYLDEDEHYWVQYSSCFKDFNIMSGMSEKHIDQNGTTRYYNANYFSVCDLGPGIKILNSRQDNKGILVTVPEHGRNSNENINEFGQNIETVNPGFISLLKGKLYNENSIYYESQDGGKYRVIFDGVTESNTNDSVCEQKHPYYVDFTYEEYDQNNNIIPDSRQKISSGYCNIGNKIEVVLMNESINWANPDGPVILTIPYIANNNQNPEEVSTGTLVRLNNINNVIIFNRKNNNKVEVRFNGLVEYNDETIHQEGEPYQMPYCSQTFPYKANIYFKEYRDSEVLEDGNLQINPCSEDSGNKVEIIKIGDMEHDEILVTVADSGETLPFQTAK